MAILTEPQLDCFIISPREAGQRLDKLLSERYSTYSRTYFQKLIEDGFVLLNSEIVKKRIAPEVGDEVEVCFQLSLESSLEPEEIPLDIIFEDEHLLVINKPAGMVVHPAPGHWSGTFVNALLAHCKNLPSTDDPLRPGIVHRLDKDTSGLLMAAKTSEAHAKLVGMFASRQIEKIYLAICMGRPEDCIIDAPIGRHPIQRKEMAVVETGGKEALSRIQVLAFNETISLVMIRPKTGRTHQIRVHLQHIGHPILGDPVYGSEHINQQFQVERQLLHAYRINFKHPITGDSISLAAPLPIDMKAWIDQISNQVL